MPTPSETKSNGKVVAIMQPYLFPYLGYYQLVASAHQFVFLDDVAYIKSGYINRNTIDLHGSEHRFVLPIHNASSNRQIRDHSFVASSDRLLLTLEHAYSKHPYFKDAFPLVEEVLLAPDRTVASLASMSIRSVFDYLGLSQEFIFASSLPSTEKSGVARVVNLCKSLGATTYHNSSGGRHLYDKDVFRAEGLALKFLSTQVTSYPQRHSHFLPNLSMLDVLMCNSRLAISTLLQRCSFD